MRFFLHDLSIKHRSFLSLKCFFRSLMDCGSSTKSAISRRRPTPYYSETNRRRKAAYCNLIVFISLILFFIFVKSFSSHSRLQFNEGFFRFPFQSHWNGKDMQTELRTFNTTESVVKNSTENDSKISELNIPDQDKLKTKSNGKKKPVDHSRDFKILEDELIYESNKEDEPVESLLKAIDLNEKYLYYPRCGDWCKGISHHRWSMLCMLGEAIYLNRTLIFDMDFCIWDGHNKGNLRVRPIAMYYNLHAIKKSIRITSRFRFTRAWNAYNSINSKPLSVRKVNKDYPSSLLLHDPSMIVWRDLGDSLSNDYAFQVCETQENKKVIKKPFGSIWGFAPHLMSVLWSISAALGWDYDAVHVRRSDKLMDKRRWPNLDKDTRPENLLLKLPSKINMSRTVYIATDERTPGFFKPLARYYTVYTLDDFAYLWQPGSEWYNQSLRIMNAVQHSDNAQPEFDAYMQAMIDYRLFELAKVKVETFNELTSDPRHGYET